MAPSGNPSGETEAGGGGVVGGTGNQRWTLPSCSTVMGTGGVTFTHDHGATLAPTAEELHGVAYTFGLVALAEANVLLAEHGGTLLRSTDAGCTWEPIGASRTGLTLVPGGPSTAFGYQDNGQGLARVDADQIVGLPAPAANIVGLAVDLRDDARLRVGDADGGLWESRDGGHHFTPIGSAPSPDGPRLSYRVAFGPSDLDHVLVGTARHGVAMTRDGGNTWTRSEGLSSVGDGPVNGFSIVVSPADPDVIWVSAIDLAEADAGHPSGGRHIYRSTDGGLTFRPAVSHGPPEVALHNQPLLAAHPHDHNVVYFVFGTPTDGTDLYRYDDRLHFGWSKTHNDYHGIHAIAFSPADPGLLYLGVSVVERNEPVRPG